MKNNSLLYPAYFLLSLFFYSVTSFADDSSLAYEQALSAYHQGEQEEAFIHLKTLLQQDPNHLPSHLLLGNIYCEYGVFSLCQKELELALELGADIHLVLPNLGASLLLQNKGDELLHYEKHYPTLNSEGKFEWHLLRAHLYLKEGNEILAEQQFNQALSLNQGSPRVLNSLADLYIKYGFLDKAKPLLDKSLAQNPKLKQTLQLQGDLTVASGDLTQSLNWYQKSYQLDKLDPITQRKLAQTLLSLGRWQEALDINSKVIAATPLDLSAKLTQATLLSELGKEQEAQIQLNEITNIASELSSDQQNLYPFTRQNSLVAGIADYLRGDLEKAEQSILRYYSLYPSDKLAISSLVKLYLQKGNTYKALSILEKHLFIVERDPSLTKLIINLYLQKRAVFEAQLRLENAMLNMPDADFSLEQVKVASAQGAKEQALGLIEQQSLITPALMIERAKLLIELQQAQTAIKTLKPLLEATPNDHFLLNLNSAALLLAGDAKQALDIAESILSQAPDNQSAQLNRASALFYLGDTELAITQLKKLRDVAPDNLNAILKLAAIYESQEEFSLAEDVLESGLARRHSDQTLLNQLSFNLIKQGKWDKANRTMQRLLNEDNLNAEYLARQAEIYAAQKNVVKLKENYQLLFQLWYEEPEKLVQLANQQLTKQLPQQAVKTLLRVLSIYPNAVPLKVDLARAYMQTQQTSLAEQTIKDVENTLKSSKKPLLTNQQQALFKVLKGDLLAERQQYSDAAQLYVDAAKQAPEQGISFVRLYQLTIEKHIDNEFFEVTEQAIEQENMPNWIIKLLADAYLLEQQSERARLRYEQLLNTSEFGRNGDIHNNLAIIYLGSDLATAQKMAEQAVSIDGNNASYQDTLGWILAQQARYESALTYLRQAYVLDSQNTEVLYHLAYVLHELDRDQEAKQHLLVLKDIGNQAEQAQATSLLEQLNP